MTASLHPAADALRALLGARFLEDPERLRRYEELERGPAGHTNGVLLPDSEEEVARILAFCNRERIPLVLSAGRTGLVEAQRPLGEAVLSLEKLKSPLKLTLASGQEFTFASGSPEAQREALLSWWDGLGRPSAVGAQIEVQTGIAIDAINELLEPLGQMFPMEMGSSAAATAGACAANASAGSNAVCYGTAAHMTAAAWGLWGNGEPAGPHATPAWTTPDPERLAIDSARIHASWGLLGSQGAYGLITRLRLNTYPIPQLREAALIPVADMPAAMALFRAAKARFHDDVEEFEFISSQAMNFVRLAQGEAFRLPFESEPDSPLFVLMQIKSQDSDAELAAALYEFLSEAGVPDEHIGYAPLPALKKIRHSITESSNARMRALGGGRLSFDTATPVSKFGPYLDALRVRIAESAPEIEFAAFGHAGVGGAHLHLLGTKENPVSVRAKELTALVFDVTLEWGGTFSAEHGVGSKWGPDYLLRTPDERLAELRSLKRLHDPLNILNPRSFGFDQLLAS